MVTPTEFREKMEKSSQKSAVKYRRLNTTQLLFNAREKMAESSSSLELSCTPGGEKTQIIIRLTK